MSSQADIRGVAAHTVAQHSSAAAVTVEELRGIEHAREVETLQMEIWGSSDAWIVPAHVLYIVSDYGGILLGARVDGRLVGFVLGFLARQNGRLFHASHMLGVLPTCQLQGIGAALKWRQREVARVQGLDLMTWTFDPLESRNAHFNLHKLGAISRTYRENYYGAMQDALNRDLPSDRLLVEWNLHDSPERPAVATEPQTILHNREGIPELHLESVQLDRPIAIEIPRDLQRLKHETPEAAVVWRLAVRQAFSLALRQGYEARDFRDGAYVLVPSEDAAQ